MPENFCDVAVEVMKENDWGIVGFSEFGRLDEIWSRALEGGVVDPIGSYGGRKSPHPLNRHERVLNYLERCDQFGKFFIRCCDSDGKGEGLKREFELEATER